jgi:hypothetical protein
VEQGRAQREVEDRLMIRVPGRTTKAPLPRVRSGLA